MAPESLIRIMARLRQALAHLHFGPPVHHVYHPLDYAWAAHCEYLERYGQGSREVLIVGMNAGYYGMAQTGVPFGDVPMVREWLGISAPVQRPTSEHPRRPIQGYACRRREVSGQRLWGWARDALHTPERFFARFFVANYCPLCFLEQSGANRTPDKLPAREREPLFAICDAALREVAEALQPRYAVGLGRVAEQRLRETLGDGVTCGGAPHPSPANPQTNEGWAPAMDRALGALGVHLPAH